MGTCRTARRLHGGEADGGAGRGGGLCRATQAAASCLCGGGLCAHRELQRLRAATAGEAAGARARRTCSSCACSSCGSLRTVRPNCESSAASWRVLTGGDTSAGTCRMLASMRDRRRHPDDTTRARARGGGKTGHVRIELEPHTINHPYMQYAQSASQSL